MIALENRWFAHGSHMVRTPPANRLRTMAFFLVRTIANHMRTACEPLRTMAAVRSANHPHPSL
jgi:hypothetical protein